jgi:two-component system response regulator FixJ
MSMSTPSPVHVIDDDDAARESLEFLLKSAKLDVRTYGSANAFLQSVSRDSGCIVTDVRMPGLSGVDLLRQLKARGSTMPVIVLPVTGISSSPLKP